MIWDLRIRDSKRRVKAEHRVMVLWQAGRTAKHRQELTDYLAMWTTVLE